MAKFRSGIVRSRTGCLTCRGRHIKCDEVKPICGSCARLNIRCEAYSPTLVFRDDTLSVKRRSQISQAQRWAAIRAEDQQREMRRRRRLEDGRSTNGTSTTHGRQVRHQNQPHSPQERPEGPWDQQNQTQCPVADSAGHYTGPTMQSRAAAEATTIHNETVLQSASPSRDLDMDLSHFEGGPPVPEALMLISLSAPPVPPTQEPEEGDLEDRSRRHSNAASSFRSVAVVQSPGAASDAGPTESRTSEPPQSSFWESPVATGSIFSQPSTPNTGAMMHTHSSAGMDDWWLNQSDMPGLPPIYKHIWESFGQSNVVLKYALLALVPVTASDRRCSITEHNNRIEYYSMALRAMTYPRQESASISDIGIELTILSLFLLLEMRFGTFKGGIAHCTQSDLLVTQNYTCLSDWHIGRELLCTWMCTRSWYYAQTSSWKAAAAGLSEPLRQLLAPILRTSPKRSQPLVPLLCQCWHISEQVILARLVGVNGKWPGFRYWCRQLESLKQQPPSLDAGMYGDPDVTEEQQLAQLDDLRAELDNWHDTLTIHDFPMLSATSETMAKLHKQPRALRGEPLCFRNHQAALTYLRYAAAQALCSKETIAELTGSSFNGEPQPNPWISLCLRIMAGLDHSACLSGDADHIGLMWIVSHVLIWRGSLDLAVIDAIETWLPWLEEVGAIPGSTCPPWCLRAVLRKVREERARGRHVLACFSDVGSSSEWMEVYSSHPSATGKMLVVGRVTETGLPFHEISTGL